VKGWDYGLKFCKKFYLMELSIKVSIKKKILKLLFDQNYHLINHMLNSNFKSHLIFLWALDVRVELLHLNSYRWVF
jgi:phage-related protein